MWLDVCLCVHVYVYVYVCLYVYIFMYVFVWMCVCMDVCMHIWMCVYVVICVCTCMWMCVCVCTYMSRVWAPPRSLSLLGKHSQAVLSLCCMLWFISLKFWTLPDGGNCLPALRKSHGVADSCMCQQEGSPTKSKIGPLCCSPYLVFKVPPFHQVKNPTLPQGSYI